MTVSVMAYHTTNQSETVTRKLLRVSYLAVVAAVYLADKKHALYLNPILSYVIFESDQ